MELSPTHKRHFALKRRVVAIMALERRLAAWLQGWTLLVIAAFAAKGVFVEVPWVAVAIMGGVETGIVCAVILVGMWKWRTEYARRETELKLLGN
jgi:hypothetical protein